MTAPHYTRIATQLLVGARRDLPPVVAPEGDARAAAIEAIERAIREKSRTRHRGRFGAVAVAAALVLGIGITAGVAHSAPSVAIAEHARFPIPAPVVHTEGDGAELVDQGPPRAESDAAPLTEGQRLVARPKGRAMLAFATGTELVLEERGDLTVQEGGPSQRFALSDGAVRAHVAKLEQGHRFVVATPDAEVEVRGTRFRVSVVKPDPSCGGGTPTRVEVSEGTVVVRRGGAEARVTAGQTWPLDCAASSQAPSAVGAPAGPVAPSPAASLPPSSRLAEQNDLFAEGLAAKRRGANAQAVAAFERYLAKYPVSALAESAMAERMKILRTPAAAKQYLARFPSGFARGDAQAILAESP